MTEENVLEALDRIGLQRIDDNEYRRCLKCGLSKPYDVATSAICGRCNNFICDVCVKHLGCELLDYLYEQNKTTGEFYIPKRYESIEEGCLQQVCDNCSYCCQCPDCGMRICEDCVTEWFDLFDGGKGCACCGYTGEYIKAKIIPLKEE
jgi:hypothetical protein